MISRAYRFDDSARSLGFGKLDNKSTAFLSKTSETETDVNHYFYIRVAVCEIKLESSVCGVDNTARVDIRISANKW